MKTILLNVEKETVEIIEIENELKAYYKALNCDLIEIFTRKIGGKLFDVMCDEEGTFKQPVKISAINDFGYPMFVGNLMFFNNDGEGNLVGLTEEDLLHITGFIQTMYTHNYPKGYPMLTQCEF